MSLCSRWPPGSKSESWRLAGMRGRPCDLSASSIHLSTSQQQVWDYGLHLFWRWTDVSSIIVPPTTNAALFHAIERTRSLWSPRWAQAVLLRCKRKVWDKHVETQRYLLAQMCKVISRLSKYLLYPLPEKCTHLVTQMRPMSPKTIQGGELSLFKDYISFFFWVTEISAAGEFWFISVWQQHSVFPDLWGLLC